MNENERPTRQLSGWWVSVAKPKRFHNVDIIMEEYCLALADCSTFGAELDDSVSLTPAPEHLMRLTDNIKTPL